MTDHKPAHSWVLVVIMAATLASCRDEATTNVTQHTPSEAQTPAGPGSVTPDGIGTHAPGTNRVYEGIVEGLGSRGDGRIRLHDRSIYIPGAQDGHRVKFVITEDRGGHSVGELRWQSPEPVADNTGNDPREDLTGRSMTAVVTDRGKQGDGKIVVNGKPIYIPDTQPGQKVTFVITEDLGHSATARVVDEE